LGLEIVSLMVNDIGDDEGYLDALGAGRTAEVKRDATIKRAEAERDAGIRSAQAERERQAARYEADTAIADSRRAYDVQKAEYEREVNTRQAEAELAYQLQEAKTKQAIRQEELNVEILERQQQTEVQEQEIARREKELAANAEAQAEAIKMHGEAEAEVIRARGFAEADVIKRKIELCGRYGQAALIQQLLEDLPEVARAMVQPPANIDGSVVINAGNSGADGTGAPKSPRDIINAVGQIPNLVTALTGIDLVAALKSLPDADPPDLRYAGPLETEKAPIKEPSANKPPSQVKG
jgi:flotillin